jgi:acyl carrier protein
MQDHDNESRTLDVVLSILRPFAKGGAVIDADTPLLEMEIIDSAAMVTILLELELRLGIRISASDLTFDHFQSARILAQRFSDRRDN